MCVCVCVCVLVALHSHVSTVLTVLMTMFVQSSHSCFKSYSMIDNFSKK